MNTIPPRRSAAALLLVFLLTFAEVEKVEAQNAFSSAPSPNTSAATVGAANNSSMPPPIAAYGSENIDRQIAATFAPVFYQGLGSNPRYDYITNFDFDNDWCGDNNWKNAGDFAFPLRSYVYYSVAETPTHYFVIYAVFHPRDYKGGMMRGRILSRLIGMGVGALGRIAPTGRVSEATLAHENDLEGTLVVAEKRGANLRDARVRFVETLAHDRFLKYLPRIETAAADTGRIGLDGQRTELYIEPRGHGIRARLTGKANRKAKDELVYKYTGEAEEVTNRSGRIIGYALVPLYTTLWASALAGENQTYAEARDYRKLLAAVAAKAAGRRQTDEGEVFSVGIGSAFRGKIGGTNMARPPWGWFDTTERKRPLGEWFFDPAGVVKRHFNLDESFSTTYTHAPAAGITRPL